MMERFSHKSHFDLGRRNTMTIDIPCVLGSQRSALGTSCSRFLLSESLNKAWFLWTWNGSAVQKDEWYCGNCRQFDTITTSINWSATCLPVTPQKLPQKCFNCYEWPIYKQAHAHQYFTSKQILFSHLLHLVHQTPCQQNVQNRIKQKKTQTQI